MFDYFILLGNLDHYECYAVTGAQTGGRQYHNHYSDLVWLKPYPLPGLDRTHPLALSRAVLIRVHIPARQAGTHDERKDGRALHYALGHVPPEGAVLGNWYWAWALRCSLLAARDAARTTFRATPLDGLLRTADPLPSLGGHQPPARRVVV